MRYLALLSLLTLVICSCVDDSPEVETISSSPYMPLTVGKYIDYRVQEIIYSNEGSSIDTSIYELREEVTGLREVSDESLMEYVIDRFTRATTTSAWEYQATWRARYADNQALRTEGNVTFVKLQLPIEVNASWDGNAYFDASAPIEIGGSEITYYKGWNSTYTELDTRVDLSGDTYNGVVAVGLADSENRIEIRKARELYANGIGLISREITVLDTQCFDECVNTPWAEKAEKGHIYTQHIIGHN